MPRKFIGRGATRRYLKEVWDYDRIVEVDPMAWECIEENAEDGFLLDEVLLRARRMMERELTDNIGKLAIIGKVEWYKAKQLVEDGAWKSIDRIVRMQNEGSLHHEAV